MCDENPGSVNSRITIFTFICGVSVRMGVRGQPGVGSHFAIKVLGIELRLSDLAARAVTHGPTSTAALSFINYKIINYQDTFSRRFVRRVY